MEIDNIYPGVAMLLFDQVGRVLLQKRADVGLWGIPSGHVEMGETVEKAAIREMLEETTLHVKVKKLIGVYSDPASQVFAYPNGKRVHFITTCFLVEAIAGELYCDEQESDGMKFFAPHELPENLLNMDPNWLKDALANEEKAFIR
ncbi:NUDIX domain-containing protein [Viridibacillus sp. YIM B01967]|uniref:NUDIX domain-containing protein n=1 Tax=Viridibacillus soli TaxID=2798301 RepID=A0ABS1H691_9BACL|nr:NUDIX domain-containing protein [Viridibacillus soli]MBK3494927.1 NUDIX domain-containing protein [Viridibacillus soli]